MKHISIKISAIIIVLCFAYACNSSKDSSDGVLGGLNGQTVIFEDAPNGLADIKFVIHPDNTFDMDIDFISLGDKMNSHGAWKIKAGVFECQFLGNEKPELTALFPSFGESYDSSLKIINDDTFEFSVNDKELWIYGVLCTKTQKKL